MRQRHTVVQRRGPVAVPVEAVWSLGPRGVRRCAQAARRGVRIFWPDKEAMLEVIYPDFPLDLTGFF